MFGDAFLTAAFSDKIYLPSGEWFDYWTGRQVRGPVTEPATFPENRGGPLYARAGALIPMAPVMDHWGELSLEKVTLEVFPGNRSAPFILYEDDGITLAHNRGAAALTEINQTLGGGRLALTLGPRRGRYAGMPQRRSYEFEVHCQRPGAVSQNGRTLSDWHYDEERGRLCLPPISVSSSKTNTIEISY